MGSQKKRLTIMAFSVNFKKQISYYTYYIAINKINRLSQCSLCGVCGDWKKILKKKTKTNKPINW